jgi:hypothetical protein
MGGEYGTRHPDVGDRGCLMQIVIDLKKLAEASFSKKDLARLAAEGSEGNAVFDSVDWTSSVMDGLEESHSFEAVLMEFIAANY